MCAVHGLVVLVEKLGAFWLRQVSEDNRRVIWILNFDGPDMHAFNATPERGHRSADAALKLSQPDRSRCGSLALLNLSNDLKVECRVYRTRHVPESTRRCLRQVGNFGDGVPDVD